MFRFIVNGERVSAEKDEKLLYFLRETLGLKSVKNGCAQGACGTCSILVDGKMTRACVLSTAKAVGKSIITCEGLSERERRVYSYAFTKAGAVQCGFCTPGMVIAAKALLDSEPTPSREQVKKALNNNICRCTGYKKIENAVLLAAQYLQSGEALPPDTSQGALGESLFRVDAPAKALGDAQYADDLQLPNMLHGSAVRSKYPRARVLSIDVSKAEALPGVVCVMTAKDLPAAQKIGHIKEDYDVLIPVGAVTHFLGDAVALIAAQDRDTLEAAKLLVEVEYEELPAVFSVEQAAEKDAPRLHGDTVGNLMSQVHLTRGNADDSIAGSAHVVTRRYKTPPTEHAFLEPECAVAVPEGDGFVIYSGDQGIYQTRHECSMCLGVEAEKVRVVAMMVGGGFGGKEDMSVQHHAALLAQKTKKPVKVCFTRDESILIHPKRHGMDIEMTTACDENGMLTAMKAVLLADTGAYASLGGPVLQRACTHAAGPYNYQIIDIVGRAYYTNNPPAGAFRGFGVSQSCFATECNLNLLAELVGISPFEIRYRNAIRPGETLPNGQIADESTALVETLDAVRGYYEKSPNSGIACAMKNSGLGVGVPDTGRVRLHIKNGLVEIHTSAACIGQGMGTVMTQIVCQTLGLTPNQVAYQTPSTDLAPDSGNTTASRQTVFTGEAARLASERIKLALDSGKSLFDLEGKEFFGEFSSETDRLGTDKPNPVSHVAYGYATQLVTLSEDGKIERVVAAHDVGRAVNPISLEGQIEGGVVMSLGWALTEQFPLENGRPKVKFGTLGLFRASQTPEIETIIIEKPATTLACGAKGVGEICSIPTAPAVALAYYKRDGVFRTELPLSGTPYSRIK